MPSLKDLRNRISSVKATQKITKAMQMVAAAKLRRAQEAVEAARPYRVRMNDVLDNVVRSYGDRDDAPELMAARAAPGVHLLLVATAERGLCGGFNATIARAARLRARELERAGTEVKIYCVGKKGHDALKREFGARIIKTVDLRSARTIAYHHASDISGDIRRLFAEGAFDVCELFFSEFQSIISQVPQRRQLIPVAPGAAADDNAENAAQHSSGNSDAAPAAVYDYEPGEAEILGDLMPRAITVEIYTALLENAASEQGARMSAMDSATRNAGEMIDRLTLSYNRQRQAQITRELIEIISGAEAL